MVETSRQELVNWVNSFLQLNISKVDECGKGFVYCQLLDSIYMDLPMSRVRFDARNDYEYLNNFKILQAAFTAHGIDRPVPLERLVKCRLQDNLEFLQWFKQYWETNYSGHNGNGYDPVARRNARPVASSGTSTPTLSTRPGSSAVRPGSSAARPSANSAASATTGKPRIAGVPTTTARKPNMRKPPIASTKSSVPATATTKPTSLRNTGPSSTHKPAPAASTISKPAGTRSVPARPATTRPAPTTPSKSAPSKPASSASASKSASSSGPHAPASAVAAQASAALVAQNDSLQKELDSTKSYISELEQEFDHINEQVDLVTSEREFYFNKLRNIEIMVQTITDLLKQKDEYEIMKAEKEAKKAALKKNKAGKEGEGDDNEEDDVEGEDEIPPVDSETLEMLQPNNIVQTIAEILYSTEDGFESPEPIDGAENELGEGMMDNNNYNDSEYIEDGFEDEMDGNGLNGVGHEIHGDEDDDETF